MTNAVSLAQQASTGVSQGFKNRIINGAMVIDQRNAGTYAAYASGSFIVDRFKYVASQASKFVLGQNLGTAPVTPPAGFTYYIGAQVSSAVSIGSSDYFLLQQMVEGYNMADLGWGTANAKTVTLSFWVRSSLTGTFGGSLANNAFDYSYPFTYTISSANTWEQKSITITGATSGTWLSTNGTGIQVTLGLGSGSTYSGTAGAWASAGYQTATGATSVVGTNGATFYITGVQLEVGSTATSFDYRPYGTELALCQRYYYRVYGTGSNNNLSYGGWIDSTTSTEQMNIFPVTMRTSPTALEQTGTAANYKIKTAGSAPISCSAVPVFSDANPAFATTTFTVASGLTAGQAGCARSNTSAAYLGWSAEL